MELVNLPYEKASKEELSDSIAEKYKYYYISKSSEVVEVFELIEMEVDKFNIKNRRK